ncbi:MAG TPA: response regulator, partial [Methylomirabilota bacterium]|nr:response regulator [Methylomirabilota bacterium]
MKTVLIIDDDHDFRSVLGLYLKQQGWRVFEAADGDAGLRMAREHRPAAVLCDLLMPRTNGFQVCSAIRNDGALREAFIVAISGKGYPTTQQSAFEAGADEFLLKPINPAELVALLDRMTGTAGAAPASRRKATPPSVVSVRFWGVRGSIPTPGPDTARYGGNTSCVEVRADGEIIILDSGTGIRPLGQALAREFAGQPLDLTLLITHTHWDHVQGFPFFAPAYDPKNQIRILGYEGAREGLAGIFSSQMESPYFPIGLSELPGHIVIEELKEMEFNIGPVKVKAAFMNHPGVCVGYRLFTSAGSIAYLPDNEPFYRLRAQPDTQLFHKEEALDFARAEDRKMQEFIRSAEVLIIDAQYDRDEYKNHVGWGHGCVDDAVALALQAGIKHLYLFHHDPSHSDERIEQLVGH